MTEITIRRAAPADAPVLAALAATTFSDTFAHLYDPGDLAAFLEDSYSVAAMAADLADPAKALWLVEAAGEAVGYAQCGPCELPHPEVTSSCRELKRFYLLKAFQNGGLGGRLFAETMDWMKAGEPRALWIGVWSENQGAQRFYQRAGFEKVGEYGFKVGSTTDLEFIFRRSADRFSNKPDRMSARIASNPV
ncbi:GNAT family N-acetyltransferase [Phenylobacterium sp.]|uniref:GNAT family N-acetyltransferase n=1 Tax=Phenylobacterium sp. TaxID=1871053 RepID=UPI002717A476|nr:GNAT family N-acetyltransferase [Phenylobacterium sp.]MDO8799000.1 GNAT family N-acetyltransferase [Phenylobacterium sp.]